MSDLDWVATYLGKAYRLGADGPDEFCCWTFFRHVQIGRFGRDIPAFATPPPMGRVRAGRTFAGRGGWVEVDPPVTGDAALMGNSRHPTHVGIFVETRTGGAILHCVEGAGSVLTRLPILKANGWWISAYYRPGRGAA